MTANFIGGTRDGRTVEFDAPPTLRICSFPKYAPDNSLESQEDYRRLVVRDGIVYFAHDREWSLLKSVDDFSVSVN